MQVLDNFHPTIFCHFPALQGRILVNISDAPYGLRMFLKGGRVHLAKLARSHQEGKRVL